MWGQLFGQHWQCAIGLVTGIATVLAYAYNSSSARVAPFPSLDYIRTFTWDKKLEMVVKSTGILGGQGERMLLCLLFELSSHIPWIIKKHGYQAWWCSVIPVLWSLRYGHLELKASFGYVRPPLYMQSKTKN